MFPDFGSSLSEFLEPLIVTDVPSLPVGPVGPVTPCGPFIY